MSRTYILNHRTSVEPFIEAAKQAAANKRQADKAATASKVNADLSEQQTLSQNYLKGHPDLPSLLNDNSNKAVPFSILIY